MARGLAPVGLRSSPNQLISYIAWERFALQRGQAPSPQANLAQARPHRLDLKGERQWRTDCLPLRQAQLEFHRIVNQHVLAGKRLRCDQP